MIVDRNNSELSTLHNQKVEEVLSKDSAQVLEDGDNPGPLEEIKFWESKRINLESLFEQMKAPTTFSNIRNTIEDS